ncbi:MAG: DUF2339 domain-containing protein [Chthoniobacterales bacterium]
MMAVFLLAALAVLGGVLLTLKKLLDRIEKLDARIASLEDRLESAKPPPPPEKIAIPASPLLAKAMTSTEPRLFSTPPPLPITSPPPPPGTPFNWEAFMGVKLFAWLGGLALFLGVVFLVKYSFENNLISPLGRIAIGAAVGAGAIVAGWWLARGRYRATAQSLCATGIVILYANLFAAHSFYGLISLTTAFFAMAAVTLFSFLLAVSLDAQVIVILGLLGGFLTPVLLPSGTDNAPALFLYIALLDLGVAAVALRKGWLYLIALAALGTVLTELGWALHFIDGANGARARWIFLGAEALFLAIFFLRRRREPPDKWTTAAAALAGFTALGFCFWISVIADYDRQPLFFLSFAFLADAGLLVLPVIGRAHRGIAVGAGALTFLLLAQWIGRVAPQIPLSATLAAVVIFALLHAATVPSSAWRPAILPFTASGTLAPFLLLILLVYRVALWNPTPVLAVALVLCAILLAAAIVRRADWLALSALVGSGLVELSWQSERFRNEQAIPAVVCYGLFLVLFVVFPFCSAQKEKAWSWAISALAQALAFWLFYRAIAQAFPNEWMGLLPAAFLVPAAVGVVALLKLYRADPAAGDVRLAWQGGVLLLFVSLIFPLQFDREWITLGWALEGLALLWLFRHLPHRGLRVVAVLLLSAAFVRLAFNPAVLEYHKRSGTRIWNWYFYAYGVTSFCLLAGARLFGRVEPKSIARPGPALLGSLGVILFFLLLNLEIADYFSIGPTLTFSFSGNFARDMTYSIGWALFALGLIIVGMKIQQRAARYAGVGLLGLTLAKLFLHDLSDLGELYRIGAFVGVAVILIAASFIYQRFLAPERS